MTLLSNSPELVLLLCPNTGAIKGCNEVAVCTYGYTREELLNLNIRDLRAPETLHKLASDFERAMAGGMVFETVHRRKDGTCLPVEVSLELVQYEGHSLLQKTIRDISRRKAREKRNETRRRKLEVMVRERTAMLEQSLVQCRLNARLFAGIFDFAVAGIALVSLAGKIIEANHALCQLLGYSAKELEGRHFEELSHPDDIVEDLGDFHAIAHCHKRSYQVEKRFVHKDGHIIWVHLEASVVKDDNGNPLFVVDMVHDITARRLAEQELRWAAVIVESTHDAIYTCDMTGTITSWNPAAEIMFGYTHSEAIGLSFWQMVPAELHEEAQSVIRFIAKTNRPKSTQTRRVTKQGKVIDVAMTVSPLTDRDERPCGWISTVRDVTEQNRINKELSRLDRLNVIGEMAAGVSHEVRNPMTTVRGFLQILSAKEEMREYSRQFKLMLDELDRMNEIITEFLSLGRNKQEDHRPYRLNAVVREIYPLLEAEALLRGINLKPELDIDDVCLPLNTREIRQLLLNLVRNAMEAAGAAGTVTVATKVSGSKVILAVEDNGCGITEQAMDKLFVPFFTTKDNGTGLGLAVSNSIAKRHEAELYVAHTGPKGTRFEVAFPVLNPRTVPQA